MTLTIPNNMAATEKNRLEFYGGKVQVDFYPNSHRYKLIELNGEERKDWIPSPSSIIAKLDKSPQLVHWAVNCFEEKVVELMRDGVNFTKDDVLNMVAEGKTAHNTKKESACSVGTVVHKYAEEYSATASVEMPDDYAELDEAEQALADKGIEAFHQWLDQVEPKFIKSEFSVFSLKQMFVGTSDELVEIDGKKYLLDYKTSKGVYSSHFYQASAYLKAYEEEYGEKLDGAMIIHVSKETGEVGVVTLSRSDLVKGYVGFKALATIHAVDKQINKTLKAYASK